MARPLRIEYRGAYYHVINRGNGGEKVFKGIGDKKKFLEYLEKTVERFSLIIHTYCLMSSEEQYCIFSLLLSDMLEIYHSRFSKRIFSYVHCPLL